MFDWSLFLRKIDKYYYISIICVFTEILKKKKNIFYYIYNNLIINTIRTSILLGYLSLATCNKQ